MSNTTFKPQLCPASEKIVGTKHPMNEMSLENGKELSHQEYLIKRGENNKEKR